MHRWCSSSANRLADDHEALAEGLSSFPAVPTTEADHRRALEVQAALATRGQHRALSLVDGLVAAVAEARDLIVLHYDADFELVADICAGVMVLPSASMARKLVADIPQITVPANWIDAVETDRLAGVELACELAQGIADSGAFDGVHLIPGIRCRETAALLEMQRLT